MRPKNEHDIVDELSKFLSDTILLAKLPDVPARFAAVDSLQTLHADLLSLRDFLYSASNGDLSKQVVLNGYLGGTLKTLQANLKHMTWQTKMVASGDFTQRIDFMGEFSQAFNTMVMQLDRTLKALVSKETELNKANEDLLKEVAARGKMAQRLNKEVSLKTFLLELHEKASTLTDREIYGYILDYAVRLSESAIGFFHLVSDDQKDIILTTWNQEALKNCVASYASHYPAEQAGSWFDCVRLGHTVIYNDFPHSPNRKGLPEGHVPIRRFMSVPVLEGDKARMVFGVGNKSEEYDEDDAARIQLIANDLLRITEQRQAAEALKNSEQKLKAVVYGSPIPQFVIGQDRRVIYWNKALEELTGVRASEVIGTNQHWRAFYRTERPCLADLVVQGTVNRISEFYEGKCANSKLVTGAYEGTDYYSDLGDEGRWLYFTAAAIEDTNGQVIGALETLEDITERKRLEEKLITQSIVDELTGLYNRRGFLTLAQQQLDVAERAQKRIVLFFIDLDRMKLINDTLGHQTGDVALMEIASALRQTFRKSDIVGRMGGDEFAVLAIDATHEAGNTIARLRNRLGKHDGPDGRRYKLSLSVGAAHFDPASPASLDDLIAKADNSMYEEKRGKR